MNPVLLDWNLSSKCKLFSTYVLEFSRKPEPLEYIERGLLRGIGSWIMEPEKFHNLLSANCRLRVSGVCRSSLNPKA